MLRNLASSLFLTERDAELDDNAPKVKGRVVTTVHKAKEVRPLVERCITIARRALEHAAAAQRSETRAERGSDTWKTWRQSDQWQQWNKDIAPAVAARRRALQLLGNKEAVKILFDEVAPRFADRSGGYTRILKLATPRLGDAGARAILEFVGVRDRVVVKTTRPAFADAEQETEEQEAAEQETAEVADTTEALDEPAGESPSDAEDALDEDGDGQETEGRSQP